MRLVPVLNAVLRRTITKNCATRRAMRLDKLMELGHFPIFNEVKTRELCSSTSHAEYPSELVRIANCFCYFSPHFGLINFCSVIVLEKWFYSLLIIVGTDLSNQSKYYAHFCNL